MATTDRIFKEFIRRFFPDFMRRFFPDFMRLFFPEEAAYLDFSTATWLEQELISNFPDQKLRVSDVVVELGTLKGEEQVVLVHIEVEASHKESLPARMFEYYSLLRTMRRKPVLPLAFVLIRRAGGLKWQSFTETLFDHTLVEFHYGQVGLLDLDGTSYLERGDPVAAALATLMQPGEKLSAEVKLEALHSVIGSGLTEGDKLFLINVVETYLPAAVLADAGEKVMQALADVEMTWLERAREEGLIAGQRKVLLHQLSVKFGPLPEPLVNRIAAITDVEQLDDLSEQLLFADSLAEIHLPDEGDNP